MSPANSPSKLSLISLLVLFRESFHIVSNMLSHDMSPVDISVERFSLAVIAWEPLLRVGDVKSSIYSSLQSSKHLPQG